MPNPIESVAARIRRALGMTLKQFNILNPGGELDRAGFPGAMVDPSDKRSFKERLIDEEKQQGWRRVR